MAENNIPETGFIRLPKVLALVPVSKSTWYEGCKTGRYPKPIKLGSRTTAWKVEDIKKLIESLGQTEPTEPQEENEQG